MRAALLLGTAFAAIPAQAAPSLKEAAALYHRGRYDSALVALDSCRSGSLKRRDSLALFQYSGMASARLGRAEAAKAEFLNLLSLDSLFQFPRNEETSILAAFARAEEEFAASAARPESPAASPPSPAADSVPAPGPADPMAAGPALRAAPPALVLPPSPPPATLRDPRDPPRPIGMALGAVPFGGGWLWRGRQGHGLTLALLQAGGAGLSIYASSRASALDDVNHGLEGDRETSEARKWQWAQRISLSTALGAYLFSLFASRRD